MTDKKLPMIREKINLQKGTWSLGGKNLPEFCGMADENAPIISNITDITYPDETLGITGANLENANLIIWAEGGIRTVKPLRSDFNKMQAVVPADMAKSVMLVWPENENGIGNPIFVNLPTIWWSNKTELFSNVKNQEIRFFGKNLSFDGKEPIVVMEGEDGVFEKLPVINCNPYQITALITKDLAANTECKFYVHNTTGGEIAWSKPISVSVSENKVLSKTELPFLSVDSFGAVANSGKDAIDAIEKALDEAAKLGGAVIAFGNGEYNISRSVTVEDRYPNGLYIVGVGAGEYDFKSHLRPDEYELRGVSGEYTSIRFLDVDNVPENIFRISGANVTISDMTLFGTDGHTLGYPMYNGATVLIRTNNVTITNVRFIKVNLFDFAVSDDAWLVGSNHIDAHAGSYNIDITNCEFHTKSSAIWLNHYEYENGGIQHVLFRDKDKVRNVNILNCDFYGYAAKYTHPSGRKPVADQGEVSRGLTGANCDGIVVENCTFKGFDQDNGYVLTRAMYLPISNLHYYIANNELRNVGNIKSLTGFDGNTGEQILFHSCLDLGGVYNVLKSEGTVLTVRTDNIKLKDDNGNFIRPDSTITNAGSRIRDGLRLGTRGTAFICAGKGAGQLRQINSYEIGAKQNKFILDEPWVIEPDETSIVVQSASMRENIIYKNLIMKDKPTMETGVKSGGVLFFFDGYSNIIAENEFKNLAFGVAFNTAFKAPLSWNTIRDNRFDSIVEAYKDAMQGGDTTRNAACLCESVVSNAGERAGCDTYHVWYTVGDAFRNNKCINSDTAVELATNRWHKLYNAGIKDYFGEEKGNALTIVENSSFENTADGVLVGNPAYWSLIRNNTYSFRKMDGYNGEKVIYEENITNFKTLNIEDDMIIDDANNTVKK